ncbi:54S ribosomal protein L22, mitochondrial [Cytospora mali]|uniref:54S ribosomal protein L22, mitochondrial n=1 Tax=Cytospora mali TaxID=578113 RepID=A0A194W9E7_CYTMA|nr:54S ribosomal protein L22, mitochondrial [Valsa mali]
MELPRERNDDLIVCANPTEDIWSLLGSGPCPLASHVLELCQQADSAAADRPLDFEIFGESFKGRYRPSYIQSFVHARLANATAILIMSLHLPSRRVLGTAPTVLKTLRPSLTLTPSQTTPAIPFILQQQKHQQQTRYASSKPQKARNRHKGHTRPADLHKSSLGDMTKVTDRKQIEEKMRDRMTSTRLESPSIFDDELKAAGGGGGGGGHVALPVDETGRGQNKSGARESFMGASMIRDHMRHAVDPDPLGRMRWERRMVVRELTRKLDPRGRETRAERIKRTEREALSKSPWLATSTKKLVHLAHQISGKTLEEARTQMKFSKKKFAREVLYELDFARDKAVVERGMGLGKVNGEVKLGETETKTVKDYRHGMWVEVDDPTRMYISEAWVNRGPWRGKKPNYRARGRVDLIQMPQASITIRLKEEKTRVREYEEKKAKEHRQGPWIHLPNRPVTAQRPFYSW